MRSFRGFVIKEFYHIIRDYRSLLILFGMPAVQLILFGYAIRNELTQAKFAVVDPSHDVVTTELVNKMSSSHYLQFDGYLKSENDIHEAFKAGEIKEVVVFDRQFAHKLTHDGVADIQLIADATDPNMGRMITGQIMGIIQQFQISGTAGGTPGRIQITPKERMLYNPDLRSVNLFVPGLIAVILMLISALMTSITITREKETGTMEILLASPLRPMQIIIGKVLPYFFLAFLDVVIVLGLALVIFHIPFRGSVALFLGESGLFALTALSLGLLISSVADSQQTAMMMALGGLLLPTILLSGFIFPVSSMPWPLQWLSAIIPARWFLVIVRGIMLKGVGLAIIWKETAILAGMTLVFLFVSIRKFKVRLD
ncbi:MAG TPA: ABC transporter permease [Balneolales bacterium]|nr:ABC transporter permease [Balneolales bacterium]